MVALKGKPTIGDDINKKILGPLAKANPQLSQADFADFNDPNKLGSGKEMVDRLTNLIAIFENLALDFSKNRADGDDLLGDAYEYLMRHFATESGKSKGQFFTPAEVSLVMSLILGLDKANLKASTTAYDPTCGSGSLLLKLAHTGFHAKGVHITLYGQEKDSSAAGLARMNMIFHNCATAEIKQGNTLANPLLLEEMAEKHCGEDGLLADAKNDKDKLTKASALREWYARQAIQHSWPRDTLTVQIKNQLHLRQGPSHHQLRPTPRAAAGWTRH